MTSTSTARVPSKKATAQRIRAIARLIRHAQETLADISHTEYTVRGHTDGQPAALLDDGVGFIEEALGYLEASARAMDAE